MHTIGFYANPKKPDAPRVARQLLDACAKAGLNVVLEPWLFRAMGDARVTCSDQIGVGVDALVVLGGDGTLLRAMPHAVAQGIPLFGVNLGRVGFLTELEPSLENDPETAARRATELEAAMLALRAGDYSVETRMLLSVNVPGQPECLALNDAVISRGGAGGVIALDAYLGDALIDHYVADGLVVATPTGSTAYSLSAGGPIVAPDVSCLVLAPICPHSLRARPMVFSPEGVLRLHVRAMQGAQRVLLIADGQAPVKLESGADVIVCRAEKSARFIRLREGNFFSLLRTKLSEWSI